VSTSCEAFRAAVSEHFWAFDTEQFDRAYAVFTPDGVLNSPDAEPKVGRTAMTERFAGGRPPGYEWVRHHLTTQAVEDLTADSALVHSYYLVYSEQGFASAGVFHDRFVLVGEEWLVAERTVERNLLG
jgi:hypothetical protein